MLFKCFIGIDKRAMKVDVGSWHGTATSAVVVIVVVAAAALNVVVNWRLCIG